MKAIARFFAVLLCLCMMFSVIACNGDEKADSQKSADSTSAQPTEPQEDDTTTAPTEDGTTTAPTEDGTTTAPTEDDTTAPNVEPQPDPTPDGQISMAELATLQIVYPFGQGDVYPTYAKQLAEQIKTHLGVTVKVTPDGYGDEATCEIILGVCKTREESLASTLTRKDDYAYSIQGKKILVAVGSANAVAPAVEHLIDNVVAGAEGELFFDGEKQTHTYEADYGADTMLLGSVDLSQAVLVYSKTGLRYEKQMALNLAEHIYQTSGYTVSVIKEGAKHESLYEVHIGETAAASAPEEALPTDAYLIEQTEFGARVVAQSPYGYYVAERTLLLALSAEQAVEKTVRLSLDTPVTGAPSPSETLRVMSFNVHYIDTELGKIDPARVPNVIETIRRADADVIGLQEVTPEWKSYLLGYLSEDYVFVGEGRDGGENGEHSLILYRKDKFVCLESDTLWLSNTPDSVSKYPESSLNRIMTYVKLQRISDGAIFVHFNTHLDHKSGDARDKQANLLVKIAEERFKDLPVFFTGDFNGTSKTEMYRNFESSGYSDSYNVAFDAVYAATAPSSNSVIDFCFVKSKAILVLKYRVDETKYTSNEDPSDHCPVIVDLVFKK